MILFQHSALDNRHHHWRTLGPLLYNLNLCAIKSNFAGLHIIGIYFFNYENPNYKKPRSDYLAQV